MKIYPCLIFKIRHTKIFYRYPNIDKTRITPKVIFGFNKVFFAIYCIKVKNCPKNVFNNFNHVSHKNLKRLQKPIFNPLQNSFQLDCWICWCQTVIEIIKTLTEAPTSKYLIFRMIISVFYYFLGHIHCLRN